MLKLFTNFDNILNPYSIDRLENEHYCLQTIGFFDNILNHYSIDRLESEYYCLQTIGFFDNILNPYSIDRLKSEHYYRTYANKPRNRVSLIILRINAKIWERNPVWKPTLFWVSLPQPNLRKINYL